MAVYKCAGKDRFDPETGEPYCDHEADRRWLGRCPGCGGLYNVIKIGADAKRSTGKTAADLGSTEEKPRLSAGWAELDHVLGGGFVKGSSTIISGPPGCGKSTLLLAVGDKIAKKGHRALIASGEQTSESLGDFIRRIGALNEFMDIIGMEDDGGDVYKVTERVENEGHAFLVLDSLQTAYLTDCKGDEGSAAQCEAVANYLSAFSGRQKVAAVIVCQINKEGDMAGPKKAEHWIDTVLEFDPCVQYDEDGELVPETKDLRRLTVGKNRHGESGLSQVFEVNAKGITPVRKKSILKLV